MSGPAYLSTNARLQFLPTAINFEISAACSNLILFHPLLLLLYLADKFGNLGGTLSERGAQKSHLSSSPLLNKGPQPEERQLMVRLCLGLRSFLPFHQTPGEGR